MEPKPQVKPTDVQKNFNSVVLTLCLMGICWIMKEVNDLEVTQAAQQVTVTGNSNSIQDLRKTVNDGATITEKMDIRLSRLETIQEQNKK